MKKTLLILCALLLTAVGASAQEETTAYKFVCSDWGSMDTNRATADDITYDEDANTITVTKTGTNNVALGNGSAYEGPFTTANYTVTNEQHWFIVVGTNLSTESGASYLWWMDGGNDGEEWAPTLVQTLSDDKVLFAWDLSVMLEIDENLQNETNNLDGWTGFGLTSTADDGTSVISDINFYTTEDAIKAYQSLEGVLQDATPYVFVCTDWSSMDSGRVSNDNITYDETNNTISVVAGTGDNNVALSNGTTAPFTTANYTVTNEQCWFVVVGTNLATGKTETNNACDSYLWWMDGANWGSWVPTEVAQSDDGTVMIAWDLSTMDAIDVNLQHQRNRLDGWTGFGLTSTTGTSVISNINFYTYDEMIEAYPELDQRAPYTFEAEEWIVPGDRPLTTAEYNSDGTITVTAGGNNGSYTNDIALGNMSSMATTGSNTANKYITSEQTYFVIIGSDLSTTLTDNALWWMNGVLRSTFDASGTISLDNDQTMVYWDLSSELTAGEDGMITLEGGTCFGLTSTASSNTSTISYIGFYTKAQLDAASNGVEWEMTSAGWGTLILPFDAEIPTVNDDGDEATLTLYAGDALSLDGTTITVSEASVAIVANTPYLVSGTAGTYSFTGTPINEADTYTVGMLTGTLVDLSLADGTLTANSGQYVLQNHTEGDEPEGLAFYQITSESSGVTLEAYHCYLTYTGAEPAALRLPGMATGIVAVESETLANDAIYDLSGRRVSKAVKGVYIQNGKKVLVK